MVMQNRKMKLKILNLGKKKTGVCVCDKREEKRSETTYRLTGKKHKIDCRLRRKKREQGLRLEARRRKK